MSSGLRSSGLRSSGLTSSELRMSRLRSSKLMSSGLSKGVCLNYIAYAHVFTFRKPRPGYRDFASFEGVVDECI